MATRLINKSAAIALGVLIACGSVALAATFNLFAPATGVLKGNASTYVTTAAVSADIRGLWTGTCNSSTFLRGDGSCATPAAGGSPGGSNGNVQFNNSGSFGGVSAFNWSAPTLTVTTPAGLAPGVSVLGNASGAPIYEWWDTSAAANNRRWWAVASGALQFYAVDDAGTPGGLSFQASRSGTTISQSALLAGSGKTLAINSAGTVTLNGSLGTSGQFFRSGGPGVNASWGSLTSGDVTGTFSGTCDSSTFLRGDGACAAGGGGGSGTVTSITAGSGITASPGSPITTTGTLSVDEAFSYTWTGNHTFSQLASFGPVTGDSAAEFLGDTNIPAVAIGGDMGTGTSYGLSIFAGSNGSDSPFYISNISSVELLRMFGNGGLTVGPSGTTNQGAGTINASAGMYVNGDPVAVQTSGTFTGTITGCTTSPTSGFRWTKIGSIVTLTMDSTITCTSNTSIHGMAAGTLPASIRPATNICAGVGGGQDGSGTKGMMTVRLRSDGTLDFQINTASLGGGGCGGANWMTSGTSVHGAWTAAYSVL